MRIQFTAATQEVTGVKGIPGLVQNITLDKIEPYAKFILDIAGKMSIAIGNDIIS